MMKELLSLWMDVILLMTLQRNTGRKSASDGSAERFNRRLDEASRYSERSDRPKDG